jgi:hypothetical protein
LAHSASREANRYDGLPFAQAVTSSLKSPCGVDRTRNAEWVQRTLKPKGETSRPQRAAGIRPGQGDVVLLHDERKP